MRRWVIFLILFAPLIWYFVKSEPGISLVNKDSLLSSLVPPSLLNDETFLGDECIVVNLDGTIFYGSHKTGEAKWAFSSGARTHASYQNVPYLNSFSTHDPFFIDTDGKGLYYYSRKGKEKLPYSIGQYVGMVPLVSPVGGVTTGSKNTSVFLVDRVSGKILNTFLAGDTRSATLGAEQRSLAEDLEKYEQVLYIMRTDYKLQHFTPNGKLVWELETAEVDAKVLCLKNTTVLGLEDSLDSKSFYHKKLNVFQLDRNSQARLPTLNAPHHNLPELYFGKGALPPPNNDGREMFDSSSIEALALPDAYFGDRPRHNLLAPSYGKGALPPSNSEGREMLGSSLALPGMNSPNTNDESPMKSLFVIIFSLLFMMGGFIFHYLTFRKQRKAKTVAEETKMQTWVPKKKKTRRLGNNKKSSSYEKDASNILDHYKVGESAGSERSEPKLLFPSSDLADREGRRIGKLLVSNNEIAKGSNGTIVLEGIYDGRPVAVKRLVRSHHDVALKEIQNLIASDQHPNIVRWYGVEHDQDFVYLSLERCSCSLNDLIYVHSKSFENHKGDDPGFLTEYHIQLHAIMGNKDIELWKTNGYPSPQLLKLMSDLVSGLAHLHELGIIHRDLKPQNVLIIKGRSLCAKLSDMGISKQLQGDRSSITQHATGYGSSGWQAPEQLQHQRQTRAVDLFSLGCLLFFCVSGGKHPYGDSIERDVNIVNDRKDLFLVQSMPEAVDLFTRLLDPNPDMRPTAVDVLHHPFFWSSETRLSFLRDASDRVELEDRETASQLLSSLENTAAVALNGKWDEKMEPAFLNNIGRYRRYKFDSIRDLLRVIRNKLNHYRELPPDIQILLGTVPEGFDSYFSSRFPKLLIQVYKVLYRFCKEEEFFRKYIKGSPALTA